VLAWGCEPHVQPLMKLNSRQKRPWVRFDWTEQALRDMARWANRPGVAKRVPFQQYDRNRRTNRA